MLRGARGQLIFLGFKMTSYHKKTPSDHLSRETLVSKPDSGGAEVVVQPASLVVSPGFKKTSLDLSFKDAGLSVLSETSKRHTCRSAAD